MNSLFKSYRFAEAICFFTASILAAVFLAVEFLCAFSASLIPKAAYLRILFALLICGIYYLGGVFCYRRVRDSSVFDNLARVYLLLYLFLILDFTLFDKSLGRGIILASEEEDLREYYLATHVNFRPFRTVVDGYWTGLLSGTIGIPTFLFNVLGNFCAFMPYSLLLPAVFPRQRKWYVYLPTVTLTVAVIEFTQFWLMVGSCDVDDVILNVGGAMIFYFLLRLPPVVRLFRIVTFRRVDIKNRPGGN